MGKRAREVLENRAVRNVARQTFDTRLSLVKQDLGARGVGARIGGTLGAKAKHTYEEAVEIAGDNRGVVAGTIAALAVWTLRNPIIAWLELLLGPSAQGFKEQEEYDREFDDFRADDWRADDH